MEFNRAQRKIINNKPSGHMLIKGISGTGKTTAFINKIPSLLNKYCISKDDRVLITTCSEENLNNISFIYENIDQEKYHQSSFFDTDNSDKLEICIIDSLTSYYFNKYQKTHKKKFNIASTTECQEELKKAINVIIEKSLQKEMKSPHKKINILKNEFAEFIQEEIAWIKACNYMNLEEYQNAYRPSRMSKNADAPKILRKNSKQRQAIYEILVEYNNNLKKVNKIDVQDMELLALKEAKTNPSKNYTHIFIDNSQDLTKVQIEFLKALYNEKTYSSITFILDTMQYNNTYAYLTKGQSFAALGYDMKGKSVSLNTIFIEEINTKFEENEVSRVEISKKMEQTQKENNVKNTVVNSTMALNKIEYIDLKRNISHKFIKDSGAEEEIYIEYNGSEEKAEAVISIPVFNEIAAGNPILINDSIEDSYYLPKEWIRNSRDAFMLKVKGDSMINKNIYDGDYVVISKQNIPNTRDIVAVDIEGEATLKTYKIIEGKIVLTPENDKYDPIIIEDQQFSFLGVAIGLIKNSEI
ncbi:LexA repressor [Clostridium puniceum]|uniref:LexA repressor n=1 Tax=Clostridium puniceum TaxID=29367 RepID=A0A1S8T0T2_9CLOT|nr:transcriptional repressor LexA [Clostridium puniceum]OOM71292.1 LexA repressor [Clostridium puniceum]